MARQNRCNFSCLTSAYNMEADHDIPLVNKNLLHLQREIQPKQSASSINLQLAYDSDDEASSDGTASPIYTPVPLEAKNSRQRCLQIFRTAFNTVAENLSSSMKKVASFIVDWSINIAQMIVHPGGVSNLPLCEQCTNDLMLAYTEAGEDSEPYKRPSSPMPIPPQDDEDDERGSSASRARGVRFSIVEDTIPALVHNEIDEDEFEDGSHLALKVKDSLTGMHQGDGGSSLETLVANLTKLIQDLGAGKISKEEIGRLESVTKDILQGAVTVANTVGEVAPEDELAADAGQKRAAILIEALINQTMDEALLDIQKSSELARSQSELLGDLIGYTLNEAVDDTKHVDENRLAKNDSLIIRKFLDNFMQKALDDIDNSRMSTESIMVSNIIKTTMVSVTTDVTTGVLPIRALENLAMAIVKSHDIVKQSKSDTGLSSPPSNGLNALEYVKTALLSLVKTIDQNKFTGSEIAAMADEMCSSVYDTSDDVGFKRLISPTSVSVMSDFVREVIINCLNQLNEATAEKVVTRILSDAAINRKSGSLVPAISNDSTASDFNYELNTFVQNVLNKSLDDSENESDDSRSYLAGIVSNTAVQNLISCILSGADDSSAMSKPKKPPTKKASLTDLVVDGFLKRVMDCAISHSQQPTYSTEEGESKTSVGETQSDMIALYVQEVLSKSKRLASQSTSDFVLNTLAKEISSSIVDRAVKIVSEEIMEERPAKHNSIDLFNIEHESHSQVFTDDSSDEEDAMKDAEPFEVEITPVLRNKHIEIDPQEISPALSAISMRATMPGHLAHRFEATARNSFASLIHPDLSRVRGLKKDSADDVKSKLHDAYMQSVMRVSKDDTVIVSDEVHEPGIPSESSSSEEDDEDDNDIKAIDCISTKVGDVATTGEPAVQASETVVLKAAGSTKSTSQTRMPKQDGSKSSIQAPGSQGVKGGSVVKVTSSGTLSRKESSSVTKVAAKVVSSGHSVVTVTNAASVKQTSLTSKTSMQKSMSRAPVATVSAGRQGAISTSSTTPLKKCSGDVSKAKVTPKTSKRSVTKTTSTVSKSKVQPGISRSTSASKANSSVVLTSKSAERRTSAGSTSSMKKRSAQNSETIVIAASKTSASKSVKSNGSGRVGPVETGSINDLRAEKAMKKKASCSSHNSQSALGSSSPANGTSLTQQALNSKSVAKSGSAEVPAARSGRKTPSDSFLYGIKSTEDPSSATDTERKLSEGEVVKVKSLYGSFSSTVQVRSSTDVNKGESSVSISRKSSGRSK